MHQPQQRGSLGYEQVWQTYREDQNREDGQRQVGRLLFLYVMVSPSPDSAPHISPAKYTATSKLT